MMPPTFVFVDCCSVPELQRRDDLIAVADGQPILLTLKTSDIDLSMWRLNERSCRLLIKFQYLQLYWNAATSEPNVLGLFRYHDVLWLASQVELIQGWQGCCVDSAVELGERQMSKSKAHFKVARSLLPFPQDPNYVVLKSTMTDVRKALESESTGPVVTLSGGPGEGKTSMARYLALYYQDASILQDEDLATENLASDIFVHGVERLWTGTECEEIRLNPPTPEEASQILTNHVYGRHFGGHFDITPPLQDAIDAVVEKADRHPLVLANMANNILRNIQAENVDHLEQWRSAVNYFKDLIQDGDSNSSVTLFNHTYPRTMKACMRMAVSSLPKNEQTLLLVASIFKSQPIPEVVFKLFFKRLHGTLANFSRCSKHLQSNNFIQIDSAQVQWSTIPEIAWSLHGMRQLLIGIIMESEWKEMGDKFLKSKTEADVILELLLLYGQDQWRHQAEQTLEIPMGQFQSDSFQSRSFQLAPIKSFLWLLHANTDEDWKTKSHQLAVQDDLTCC